MIVSSSSGGQADLGGRELMRRPAKWEFGVVDMPSIDEALMLD